VESASLTVATPAWIVKTRAKKSYWRPPRSGRRSNPVLRMDQHRRCRRELSLWPP